MALVRIRALKDFLDTALSTTGVTAAANYSTAAPQAGESLYAALHLTAVSTARIFAGTVQAASSSGFATITTESTMQRLAAPSTDRPWRRASWTLSTVGLTTGGSWNGLVWAGFR